MSNQINELKKQQHQNTLKLVLTTLGVTILCIAGVLCVLFFAITLMNLIETNNLTANSIVLTVGLLGSGIICCGIGCKLIPKVWSQQSVADQLKVNILRVETQTAIQAGAVSLAADPTSDGGLSQVHERGDLTSTMPHDDTDETLS